MKSAHRYLIEEAVQEPDFLRFEVPDGFGGEEVCRHASKMIEAVEAEDGGAEFFVYFGEKAREEWVRPAIGYGNEDYETVADYTAGGAVERIMERYFELVDGPEEKPVLSSEFSFHLTLIPVIRVQATSLAEARQKVAVIANSAVVSFIQNDTIVTDASDQEGEPEWIE